MKGIACGILALAGCSLYFGEPTNEPRYCERDVYPTFSEVDATFGVDTSGADVCIHMAYTGGPRPQLVVTTRSSDEVVETLENTVFDPIESASITQLSPTTTSLSWNAPSTIPSDVVLWLRAKSGTASGTLRLVAFD